MGCSVSCSGYAEDFNGKLAYGDFGILNMADGEAKIEGFGMHHYNIVTNQGKQCTLLVPGYLAPTVQMRLISPQDYAHYHHFPTDEYQFAGNAHWMFMYIKVDDNLETCEIAMANIDPGA